MKTFWLLEKDSDNQTNILMEADAANTSGMVNKNNDSNLFVMDESDTRSLYSPVLPEDVNKLSPAHVCPFSDFSLSDDK